MFAIKVADNVAPPASRTHLAFTAPNRNAVVKFHEAALHSGGSENGPPGLRPNYGPGYFAAFVIDPDGYRIETVVQESTG